MNRTSFTTAALLLIGSIAIAGVVFYYFAHHPRSESAITQTAYPTISPTPTTSSITTLPPIQPPSSSTPENGISIPQNALTSSDHKWIAFEKGSIGNNFPTDTETTGELDILSIDGSITKMFTPAQLDVVPTCDCSVSILGWGKGLLWLENDPYQEGPINSFLKLDTGDWLITSYPANLSDISYRNTFNFDTGQFVTTDLPWSPDSDDNPAQDPTVYSVSIYDILTGSSQIIETTTAESAAPMRISFGSDLKWLNDNTLQYYNFRLGGLATTSASE